jgi:hypothetical protein
MLKRHQRLCAERIVVSSQPVSIPLQQSSRDQRLDVFVNPPVVAAQSLCQDADVAGGFAMNVTEKLKPFRRHDAHEPLPGGEAGMPRADILATRHAVPAIEETAGNVVDALADMSTGRYPRLCY